MIGLFAKEPYFLQGSFAKETCKRHDILQERPIILRSLLIVATAYNNLASGVCSGVVV